MPADPTMVAHSSVLAIPTGGSAYPPPGVSPTTPEFQVQSGDVILVNFRTDRQVAKRVLGALSKSEADWRTPASLSRELGVSELEIRTAVEDLGDLVRRPVAARKSEKDYVLLVERVMTPGERIRNMLSLAGRVSPSR